MQYPVSALWRIEMCMYIVVFVDRNYDLFPNPFRFHLLLYLPHLLYTLWITEVYHSLIRRRQMSGISLFVTIWVVVPRLLAAVLRLRKRE